MHPNSTVRPTMRDLIDAPLGTVIRNNDGIVLRKDTGGFWPANSYQPYGVSYIAGHEFHVESVGTVPDHETLAQFKQRLRTLAYGHAAVHSIRKEYIDAAMGALGIEDDLTLRPGMYFHPFDLDLCNVVPSGTLLVSGDPEAEGHHAVALYTGGQGRMEPLLGERRWESHSWGRVLRFPDDTEVEPWPEFDGTPEQEREAIHAFRRRTWEIGYRAKQDRDWCGQFEVMVGWVWVDASVLNEPVGDSEVVTGASEEEHGEDVVQSGTRPEVFRRIDQMDNDAVNALPLGAITAYETVANSSDSWNWMVRTDAVAHPQRTDNLMGPNGGGWGTQSVVWEGNDSNMEVRVCTVDHLQAASVGTVIRAGTGRVKWTKISAEEWVRERAVGEDATRVDVLPTERFAINDQSDPVFTHIYGQPVVGGRVASKDSFEAAKDGTEVQSVDSSRVYVKRDGHWRSASGRASDALRYDNMRWSLIPEQF